jgi:hypothetical protein
MILMKYSTFFNSLFFMGIKIYWKKDFNKDYVIFVLGGTP